MQIVVSTSLVMLRCRKSEKRNMMALCREVEGLKPTTCMLGVLELGNLALDSTCTCQHVLIKNSGSGNLFSLI